jgi:hypothetical protein
MATVTQTYRASSALSVTNLHSQPSNATWTTGWAGPTVDNSSNLDLDHLVAGQITLAAASLSAGVIRVYLVPQSDDTTWPDIFSTGTEGTQSASAVLHDTTTRDTLPLLWECATDTDASRVYTMPQTSVLARFGFMPRKYFLFVAHSTAQNLAASGNAFYVTGVYATVA